MFKLKYFNNHLSQGFVSLYSGRMVQFIAMGLIELFLPVFLLTKLSFKVEYVFLYYIIGYLCYCLLLPFTARILNKIGLRRSLRISVFLGAVPYVCFYLIDKNPHLFLIMSLVFLTLYRLTFWLPFHTDFAKFTSRSDRGKEVSLMWATKSFLSVIMPLISGTLIAKLGFNIVFVITIIVYLTSIIPFLALPRTREKYSWGIFETFKKFFSRENRKLIIANMANGAENAVGIIIWPIFIWQLLKGNYFQVGVLSSLIVFITVILELTVGKYADILDKRKLIHWGSVFYALGWLAKIFVLTAFQIFIVGTYHKFTQIFKDTPFDALNYELMADHGHYVDEYTVLKEMAVQLGKGLILLFAILVLFNFGLNWTFALAALASLLINLM